jgi:predicted alpha-1,2-mannosidase
MKKGALALVPFVVLCGGVFLVASPSKEQKQPVDYVSPNIGGIGQLLTATIPYVQYPHGMVRLAPITTPGITDRYLADKIYGFPAGPAMLMASVGSQSNRPEAYASEFDHDFETSTPYYYAADLETWGIAAELTAAQSAAYYRFTFPESRHAHLVFSMEKDAELTVIGDRAVQGSQRILGPVGKLANPDGETRAYFYAEFSRSFDTYKTWQNDDSAHTAQQAGDHIGFVTDSPSTSGEQIEVRVGLSYISAEQARRNLEREIPDWNFERVKSETRAVWSKGLSQIQTAGGTERERTIFYTALYRSLQRMTDITEDDKYFSGYDHQVHAAQGHHFYIDDGLWDTYRSLHPLQLLIEPRRQQDMVRSYLGMYEQSGWLPSFPSVAGEQAVMIGHHAAPFILDTYMKGYRDFDAEEAYAAVRKSATDATMIPWNRGRLTNLDRTYLEEGFFPALARGEKENVPQVNGERRQAVSVTIEGSYDDWSVGELAKALGKQSDQIYFTKLAHNYGNVFDPTIQFMAPRSADGNWIPHLNPKLDVIDHLKT